MKCFFPIQSKGTLNFSFDKFLLYLHMYFTILCGFAKHGIKHNFWKQGMYCVTPKNISKLMLNKSKHFSWFIKPIQLVCENTSEI